MPVRHNPERNRYELYVDDELVAVADYYVRGDVLVFPHTEVRSDMQGRGLGATLLQGALDDVRSTGRSIVPRCSFVADFVDRHPEYADLVAA